MWQCVNCDKRFKNPDIGITCPFCGSEDVRDYSDSHLSKTDGLICSKCKIESEEAGLYTLCPSCGIGFMMSEQELLKAEMEAMEADLSEADLFAMDEIEAEMESEAEEAGIGDLYETENPIIEGRPEHPNCFCSSLGDFKAAGLDEETIKYLRNNAVAKFPLSFNDLDINEKLLLDLPIEDVVPITYITEMNYRFLHTFVDGCFVPA